MKAHKLTIAAALVLSAPAFGQWALPKDPQPT